MDLTRAYHTLRINDPSLRDNDEDIIAAYFDGVNKRDSTASVTLLKEALDAVAAARSSRLIYFVLGVLQDQYTHWATARWHEAGEKISATASPVTLGGPEVINLEVNEEEEVDEEESSGHGGPFTPSTSDDAASGNDDQESSDDDMSLETMMDSADSASVTSESASSAGMHTDSTLSDSEDSDFSEEAGGEFWNNKSNTWSCEYCNADLEEGICPRCPTIERCGTCTWKLEDGICPKCHHCRGCGASNNEAEGEEQITFDPTDKIWRCVDCGWEVEATSELGGHCFCMTEEKRRHYHDLSGCPDYEPGEPCETDEESEDSEPDSEDEHFIDDDDDLLGDKPFDTNTETAILAKSITRHYSATFQGLIDLADAAQAGLAPSTASQDTPDDSMGT